MPLSPIDRLLDQHWKTQAVLTTALMNARGWQPRHVDPEQLQGPQVFVYLWDQPTNWVWSCSMPAAVFVALSQSAHTKRSLWPDIRGGVVACLLEALAAPDSTEWEQPLGTVLAAYAGTTQTWTAACHLACGGHFVVLNYRAVDCNTGNLRPFATIGGSERRVMEASILQALITQVFQADKTSHPEWFA